MPKRLKMPFVEPATKPKIFLTCFTPFGGREENQSFKLVSQLGYQYLQLDVSWNKVEADIKGIIDMRPIYLIMFGEAIKYQEVMAEMVAHNIALGTDNEGVKKDDEMIDSELPHELKTSLNVQGFFKESYDAGKYLCNYAYFEALKLTRDANIKVIFIHLPILDGIFEETKRQVLKFLNSLD